MGRLSDEGAARYTDALLSREEIYESLDDAPHATVDSYPELECESPHIGILRRHGKIRTANGDIVQRSRRHSDPTRSAATRCMHSWCIPRQIRIKAAFGLSEPSARDSSEKRIQFR